MPCKCDENTTFAVYNPPVVINMLKRILLLSAMTVMLSVSAPAVCPPSDSLVSVTDTALHVHKPRPWMAAAEVAGINIGILAFDRFILNEEFAHVTMKTLRRNIKLSHWFWDSDHMYTNLMSHPYHGSLYYNAARSNGMSYAVSTLYSTIGSLMWEIGGENELLSVNDFLSTSIGGAAIGETAYRLSDLIIDDTQTGSQRFFREAAAFLVNPIRGIDRLIHGESWHHHAMRTTFVPQHFYMDVSAGVRMLHSAGRERTDLRTAFVATDIEYGDAVQQPNDRKPYSYFLFSSCLAVGKRQPLINKVNLIGRIASTAFDVGKGGMELGLYQHFNFMQTDQAGERDRHYKVSEAFSAGVGMQYATSDEGRLRLRGGLYANAMVLGGISTDIAHDFIDRDNSMGSGFTLRWNTVCEAGKVLRLRLGAEYYRLFTWMDCTKVDQSKPFYRWSMQGDEGVGGLSVFNSSLNLRLWKGWGMYAGAQYFNRHTHYKYYPAQSPAHSHTWELRLGMSVGW